MTTGFFSRATATTRANLTHLGGKTVRTPVSLPADVGDAKRSLSAGAGTAGLGRPRIGVPTGDRRRIGTLIGGLAAIFLVLTVAGVAARHIHITPVTTARSTPTAGAHATRATASDVSRLAGATTATASASADVRWQLATLGAFPSAQLVSTVVTVPYVDTLELYQGVLAGTPAPASATKALRTLHDELRADIATFGTASAVAPDHLGQFLDSFVLRVGALQADLTTLQRTLHPSPARS
jgi:hypothetical protein